MWLSAIPFRISVDQRTMAQEEGILSGIVSRVITNKKFCFIKNTDCLASASHNDVFTFLPNSPQQWADAQGKLLDNNPVAKTLLVKAKLSDKDGSKL